MPRYRLLVTDLDGTLLGRTHAVSPRNLEALHAAQAAGMVVLVATGRSWLESRLALDQIPFIDHAITASGACLADARSGRLIHCYSMGEQAVAGCVEAIVSAGHLAYALTNRERCGHDYLIVGEAEMDPASRWWFSEFALKRRVVSDFVNWGDRALARHVFRVGTVASRHQLSRLVENMESSLSDSISVKHWPAVTATEAIGSETHMLEAFHPTVDKWTMVSRVCQDMGIGEQEVVAIGDGLNDLEMIRRAGLGIAMANADERVAQVARAHTGHHDEDGFADAVERLLEGAALAAEPLGGKL